MTATPDIATQLQEADEFIIRQRITPMVNRYEVHLPAAPGSQEEGALVAFVEQKRLKLKEEFTIWADAEKSTALATIKADRALDVGASYAVTDPAGQVVGSFRKDFKASLLRSTFHLTDAEGRQITARERSLGRALFRRLADMSDSVLGLIPVLFHFDFETEDGELVATVDRRAGIRDRYRLKIEPNGQALDRRVAIALAVAMDALLAR